jgi:hypothetical protein
VSADIAHELQSTKRTAVGSLRARLVLGLGPATAFAGVAWAVLQPWRLTLLHPHGQGFWWLVSQPPLYVVIVGVVFRLMIAPALVEDLLAADREAGR